jgi:CTP:molybdopterin cytidylyltransferase MocA
MLAAVIPSAGASRRMRFPKGALRIGGRSLLSSQCDALFREVDRVVVVLGWGAALVARDLRQEVTRIVAVDWWRGSQADSVRLGLQQLPGCTRLLVQPVDVPPVSPAVLQALLTCQHSTVPYHRGQPGHPVLLAGPELAALRQATPPRGLRSLLVDAGRIDVDDPAVCANLNHPRQLVHWLRASSPGATPRVMPSP